MIITAQDVKKLRDLTGAGMMDCKKALTEAEGDFDKSIEILRKKGQKISSARADRGTSEGMVFAKTNEHGNYGVIMALGCETDFVAKNEFFQTLGNSILEVAFSHKLANTQLLMSAKIDGLTVEEKITELVGKVGEKITISTYKTLTSDAVIPYIHAGGRLGVLVGLKNTTLAKSAEVGRDIAMQIAAMSPIAVNKEQVTADVVEKELSIARELARNEGNPEAMIEKIAQGRLSKFFKESILTIQPFIKDNGVTVGQHLQNTVPGATVADFIRVDVSN